MYLYVYIKIYIFVSIYLYDMRMYVFIFTYVNVYTRMFICIIYTVLYTGICFEHDRPLEKLYLYMYICGHVY